MREPYESDAVEIGFTVGSISGCDAPTEEEAEEEQPERIPPGFVAGKRKRVNIGGRRAGSWPRIGWLS